MLASRAQFFGGVALMAGFIVVLVVMFMPIFAGQNALDYLDSLYNSISKDSAYYIGDLLADSESRVGTSIDVKLTLHGTAQALETAALFERAGATVTVEGEALGVAGDLGRILEVCLQDSDSMFANDGGSAG